MCEYLHNFFITINGNDNYNKLIIYKEQNFTAIITHQ